MIAKAKGKAVGSITTTRITHATPAATYSHACHRDAESDIAAQAVPGGVGYNAALKDGVDVLMGGGSKFFTPTAAGGVRVDDVSGCLYAVRRSCHQKLANDMIDDFVIATEIRLQGLRTVYEPAAISTEDTNKLGKDEFRMRVRVIQQTFSALHRYSEVLSLGEHGLYAFQMISHKVLRYLVPVFLLLILLSNGALLHEHLIFSVSFFAQVACYLLAVLGWAGDKLGLKLGSFALPYYFILANTAIVMAFVKFMRGESRVVWQSVRDNKLSTEAPEAKASQTA